MSEPAPVRKIVKPAHPGGRIPDPAHAMMDLPADGIEVAWDHYWIAREARGEIIVVEPVAAAKPAAPLPASAKPAA